ncbi:MAG: hypothetical protein ACREBS_05790 [Nitrososphaerales archaeon]
MLDISLKSDVQDRAIVYLDGPDARIFAHLSSKLGSEERVQAAMILTGMLEKLKSDKSRVSARKAKKVMDSFPEFTGISLKEFRKLIDALS